MIRSTMTKSLINPRLHAVISQTSDPAAARPWYASAARAARRETPAGYLPRAMYQDPAPWLCPEKNATWRRAIQKIIGVQRRRPANHTSATGSP